MTTRRYSPIWTRTDEIERLDSLAGILLQTSIAISIAGPTLLSTTGVSSSAQCMLIIATAAGVVSGLLALIALSVGPSSRYTPKTERAFVKAIKKAGLPIANPGQDVVKRKARRVQAGLYILTLTIELLALVALIGEIL